MASLQGIEQMREAAIDGRTDNVKYRQNELQKLHAALCNSADAIVSGISKDANGPEAGIDPEAGAEYYLAMSAVKGFYQSLNFKEATKNEYLLANGADNTCRRVGKGLVIIRPTTHTRFYSVICPIATAIAAGNCVCLELGDTMLNIDRVLKHLLSQTLDVDTFYISDSKLQDASILASALLVDQTSDSSPATLNQLPSNTSARAIAVVDRAADIELAAKAIVTARFSFQGTSPYSPDLVLVNDFIKSDFIEACTRYATKFFSAYPKMRKAQSNDNTATKKAMRDAEGKGHISVFGSNNFVLVDIHERTAPITQMKITGRNLLILESTSLVDSVMLQKPTSPLLAVYLFSDPPTAKFLAQHFNASVTYVNQIPLHLLIGPAAPLGTIDAPTSHKYSVEMFSTTRPQFITPPSSNLSVIDELLGPSQSAGNRAVLLKKLQSSAVEPLPKTGQPSGHAIGFFEQGILLGAGMLLVIIVPTVGYSSWVVGRQAWRMFVRSRFS